MGITYQLEFNSVSSFIGEQRNRQFVIQEGFFSSSLDCLFRVVFIFVFHASIAQCNKYEYEIEKN